MSKNLVALMVLAASVAFTVPALADGDPTMQQIYDTAKSGHVAQAQQMIDQVLRDHPRSAKAHYVAAELYAKQGNLPDARRELAQAEQLEPGLPFAEARSVQALKAELSLAPRGAARVEAPASRSFPWGAVLLGIGVIAALWAIFRRRSAPPAVYPGGGVYPSGGVPAGGAPPYGPAGYGPGAGGMGSGIVGGLASGLAVGAGVVAGEELAHKFLDGDRREAGVAPAPEYREDPPLNGDMGGSDFGIDDTSSWDDSGAGSGGGSDDWN